MFDTVASILENGPYCPKDTSCNSWEGSMRDYFDDTDNCRKTSVSQTLNRPEARILIYGDGGGIRIESSLPKLLYGNNLSSVSNAQPALKRLREFALDYVSGDLPDLDEMRYTRVDYCHNFALGNLLPEYVTTLSKVCYLTHRRTTKGELKRLGLWPPSAASVDLPGLRLPPLEQLPSDQIVLLPKSPAFVDCADSSARIESAA